MKKLYLQQTLNYNKNGQIKQDNQNPSNSNFKWVANHIIT